MKDKFDDLGANIENVRRILSNCSAQLQQNYPEFSVHTFANNGESNGFGLNDRNSETTHDCRGMNDSRKLSSQERESRRKLSLEKIKRDFHVFSELSTILEQSREQRSSSVIFGRESMHRMSTKLTEKAALVSNSSKSNLKCRISDVPTIGEVDSDAENDVQEEKDGSKDGSKTAQNLELSRTNSQKLPLRNSTNSQTLSQSNNTLITNLSQVYDISNKENVMPTVLSSDSSRFSLNVFDLAVPQHSSSPVKSINTSNQYNDITTKSNFVDFSFSDDFNDKTFRNSNATVLAEETYDYRNSFMDKALTGSLREVMETPQLPNGRITEKIRSDKDMFEPEIISLINGVELDVSRLDITNKSIGETQSRAKRSRRNSVRIINYDESSEPDNQIPVTAKKKPKRKTSQSEGQKTVVTKPRKTRSQSKPQTEGKKKKKPIETKDDSEQQSSVYDFQEEEEDNSVSTEKKVLSRPRRTKAKK